MAEATEERTTESETQETPDGLPLDSTELYANRELSWLDFNDRVLQLAEDERLPLLERVKFLAIYSSNLDEFFMVRVAGHHDQVDARIDSRGPDGLSPSETIERIAEKVTEQGKRATTSGRTCCGPSSRSTASGS